MTNFRQRIELLETNLKSNLGMLFIIVDNTLTDEQQIQLDKATANKRTVVQLSAIDLKL